MGGAPLNFDAVGSFIFNGEIKLKVINALSCARLCAVLCLVAACARFSAFAGEVTLEDNSILVAFDSDSGALTRLEDKTTHWKIERRPELGVSFRLFAPLLNRRYNPVLGQKQHAGVEKRSDHNVRLQWKNLLSENGGVLPMTLAADATLTNGALTFETTLENDSPLPVETIDYPYFGDFNPPSRDATMEAQTMRDRKTINLQTNEIYPHFRNEKGYWGVDFPTKTLEAQQSPVCLIQTPGGGLYVGVEDLSYRLQYTFEQHPGVISSVTGLVPQADEISGIPVHLEFRACHFIFAHPHLTVKLAPVVLRCYTGDSRAGVELYQQQLSARGGQ
jgi:hypothetical protein